ncbi:MAG TPA: diguanylate cyclase [Pyrinomonadaceae bacterium]|jgi:diguanylate cyclase (GGDEF)-like protein
MSAPAQAKSKDLACTRDQGRVLLVTDEPAIAAYGATLEDAGFVVVGVAGGAAALVALRQTRPHIVIADINLKGITAQELTRMLAQTQDGPPLLLIGPDAATTEKRAASLSAGAFDYFQLPREMALLLARATQLTKLSQAIDRLRAEAERDYLTGLVNRRYFRKALGQELERWRRYNVPCALLILDIDHMKRINDTHGHSAGDVVIMHIATALKELSRDNDTTARLGGEEFALLLAGVDDTRAIAAAERLRHDISAEEIEGIGRVTVSLGVAACPAHATSERALYAASDAALYHAKGEGRNQTSVAPALIA